MRVLSVLFLFLISYTGIRGQATYPCGTDYVMKKYLEQYPDRKQQRSQTNKLEYTNLASLNTKIIPVVFHVVHNGNTIGDDENISYAQIQDAINNMNQDFSASNTDIENVASEFQDIIGSANTEFRLAQLDPEGNCTNGITRTMSELTNNANDCIKSIISWDDSMYINIWVVEDIDPEIGAAAYTYLPGTLWGDEVEGIIINHQYVGGIGSSLGTAYARHTLSHEMGHFFNLSHTWGGYADVGLAENCSNDDGVNDTPNTIGSYGTCLLSQETCGSLDNVQNIMDYASCTSMFTVGQCDRMNDCLNSSVSDRNNLWSNNNLWDTGTHSNYSSKPCGPELDFFTSQVDRICTNSDVTILNNSIYTNNNSILSWSFPGANQEFSSDPNPIVNYSIPGEYEIGLTISTDEGESTLTKNYTVYESNTTLFESFYSNFFPLNNNANLCWTIVAPENENSWTRTYQASSEGTGSVRIRSRFFESNNSCSGKNKHFLYSPNLNLSFYGIGIGEPLKILFDYAYVRRNNQSNDLLVVSYSKNCGESWQVRGAWETAELITNNGANVSSAFIPSDDEWETRAVNIQAAAEQSDVIIRFEFSGESGNYLYIDNVRLEGEWIGVNETNVNLNPHLIKEVDLLGRENKTSPLKIKIYNNGTIKKYYSVH